MTKEQLVELKEQLTTEQVFELLESLGAEPILKGNYISCITICHGGEQHKLYYYINSHLFRCFTECDETFDIFELIIKVKQVEGNKDFKLSNAVAFICNHFNISVAADDENNAFSTQSDKDWKILKKYSIIKKEEKNNNENIKLNTFNKSLIDNLPQPRIIPWENDGISNDIIKSHNIKYDPVNEGIVIPHYDINGELVGIRERTLIKENEKYGKYRPAVINYKMYNHPLGYNLYNLNNSKKNIQQMKIAIVFEAEKSCLQYCSFMGEENDITCAVCGSNLTSYQFNLLLSLGIKELVVGFDRQYKEIGDKEWAGWKTKLENIHNKFGLYCQISYLFDKEHLIEYKDSPTDKGKEVFLKLFKNRIVI